MKALLLIGTVLLSSLSMDVQAQITEVNPCDCKITFADKSEGEVIYISQYLIVGPEEPTVQRIALKTQTYPSEIKATEEYISRFAASFCEVDGYHLTSILVRRNMETEEAYEILLVYDPYSKQ